MFALFVWGWYNTDSLALVGAFPVVGLGFASAGGFVDFSSVGVFVAFWVL